MNRMLTFDEVKIIKLKNFNDSRGFFTETYNKKLLLDSGIDDNFIQLNINSVAMIQAIMFQKPKYVSIINCGIKMNKN